MGKRLHDISFLVDVSLLCLVFFALGYAFKDAILHRFDWQIGASCFTISVLIYCLLPGGSNVSTNEINGGYPRFVILATLSSLAIISLSKWLLHFRHLSNVLAYYGRNSLIVLCTHTLFMPPTYWLVEHMGTSVLTTNIGSLIILMLIEIPVINVINKYLPFLLGNFKASHSINK